MTHTGRFSPTEDPFDLDQEINKFCDRVDDIIVEIEIYNKDGDSNVIKRAIINQVLDSMKL